MKNVLAILLGSLLFTGIASAAEGAVSFTSLDKDSNGKISKQEAQANAEVAEVFSYADKDGDGNLTSEEFDVAMGEGEPE